MGKDANTIKQEIEETRERMGDTVEALGYKADVPSRVKDDVKRRVDAVKGGLTDLVGNVKSAVDASQQDASDRIVQGYSAGADSLAVTRDGVRSTVATVGDGLGKQSAKISDNAGRAANAIRENPIGLSLAALAVGFLVGSILPVSEAERTRLQPLSDRVIEQAKAATGDLVDAGKAVFAETTQSAIDTAVGSVQSHSREVLDAAKARANET